MILRMGIDIAVRAPHQASLADERGELVWSGYRFRTTATELDQLWERLPAGSEPSELTIVMEPTRNAWVPLAAWLRRKGAHVVLVSAERSADLRAYYTKHTKSDRLDSVLLARLPMLHPEGLHPERGLGPGDPLRRTTKLHSTLVKRRTTSLARLDALLEILAPDWHAAFSAGLGNNTPLRFLAAGYADPHTVRRLGRARLTRFFRRHSRGAAARASLQLWDEDISFPDLAEDIAVEARLALALTEEIKELDERIAVLVRERDPQGIVSSAPASAQSLARSSSVGSVTPPGSPPWPPPARSVAWSFPGLLWSFWPARWTHQARRRPTPRSPIHQRQPSPTPRSDAGSQIPPRHGRDRQAPQLRALPHRDHPAHQGGRLLEQPDALPAPRR
ncbi:IS110 family transposase [Kribbella sp. NBC_00359]